MVQQTQNSLADKDIMVITASLGASPPPHPCWAWHKYHFVKNKKQKKNLQDCIIQWDKYHEMD